MSGTIPLPVRHLLDLVLPPACAGCGIPLPRGSRGPRVCPGCRSRLRPLPHPRCARCHAPRGSGLPADRPCPECVEWPPVLAWARSAFVLADPGSALIHSLKYGGWPELAGEMADMMAGASLLPGDVDEDALLVPIPTTPSRERERGYNQAELLARALARRTGRTVVEALARREGGGTQVSLHPSERRANVLEAFFLRGAAEPGVEGREVVLVDDVLTTGATGTAAAEVLAGAGASKVGLVTFARALPSQEAGPDPAGPSGVLPIPPTRRRGRNR